MICKGILILRIMVKYILIIHCISKVICVFLVKIGFYPETKIVLKVAIFFSFAGFESPFEGLKPILDPKTYCFLIFGAFLKFFQFFYFLTYTRNAQCVIFNTNFFD